MSYAGSSSAALQPVERGSIVWRPVKFNIKKRPVTAALHKFDFDPTERGNVCCKIDTRFDHGEWMPNGVYELIGNTRREFRNGEETAVPNRGIMLFVDVKPTDLDWNGVLVTSVMQRAIFGTPLKIVSLDEYISFRLALYNLFSRFPSMDKAQQDAMCFYKDFMEANIQMIREVGEASLRRFRESRRQSN